MDSQALYMVRVQKGGIEVHALKPTRGDDIYHCHYSGTFTIWAAAGTSTSGPNDQTAKLLQPCCSFNIALRSCC